MRDPARIQPLGNTLIGLWQMNPDLRLGQFMINMLQAYHDETGVDPFFVEDIPLIQFMTKYCLEHARDRGKSIDS